MFNNFLLTKFRRRPPIFRRRHPIISSENIVRNFVGFFASYFVSDAQPFCQKFRRRPLKKSSATPMFRRRPPENSPEISSAIPPKISSATPNKSPATPRNFVGDPPPIVVGSRRVFLEGICATLFLAFRQNLLGRRNRTSGNAFCSG